LRWDDIFRQVDDRQLLEAWKLGDRAAGQELFSRYFGTVRRFFANKVRDDPEELIQTTFLACIEAHARVTNVDNFRAYLLGIARNLLRKHWERQVGRGRTDDIDEVAIADLGAGPSSVLARDQRERRLLDALRHVSLADQEILELYYWEQLSGPELAAVLEIPESSARSRLRRAKLALGKEYRRLERFAGAPESSDEDIEQWAANTRHRMSHGKLEN
jgi:RNA polymerase sigma factor (sigma-70 family)